MSLIFFVLATLATAFVLALFIRSMKRKEESPSDEPHDSYEQAKPLSDPEQVLYWRLRDALPECVILPQVTFSRFMRPVTNGKVPLPQYRALQNRLSQKTIDYLVCLKDFTIVAAVELDDSSHWRTKDERRDELLSAAGISVVRMRVSDIPTAAELRAKFTISS